MKKMVLIAVEVPDGEVTEELIQNIVENACDLEPEDLTVVDESVVPDSAYKMPC